MRVVLTNATELDAEDVLRLTISRCRAASTISVLLPPGETATLDGPVPGPWDASAAWFRKPEGLAGASGAL
jgi:hypothetical protein